MILTYKKVKCNKCNRMIDSWDYNWHGGLCNYHNKIRSIIYSLIGFLIILLIALPIQVINFSYDYDKCSNLKSDESSYNFTNRVEINARYNEDCYFLHNHPLALPSYFVGAFFMGIVGVMFGLLLSTFIKPLGFKRIPDEEMWENK